MKFSYQCAFRLKVVEEIKLLAADESTSEGCGFEDLGSVNNHVAANSKEVAEILAATSDPVRLKLLAFHKNAYPQPLCACALVANVGRSQSTVSHHLAMLVSSGWLTSERRGKWIWYRFAPSRVALFKAIEELALSLEGPTGS